MYGAFTSGVYMRRLFVLAGFLIVAALGTRPALAASSDSTAAGGAYCVNEGGTVQVRQPTYGTNGGVTPLKLADVKAFCQFTSKKDGSSIYVLIDTLTTSKPTLAALAYYAQVKFDGSTCQGSPGSCYCSQLGGTDLFGGINAAGGGWVLNTDPTDTLDACIFPDESSIDSYGLFYHSAGIVRGKNLAKVLIYKNPN